MLGDLKQLRAFLAIARLGNFTRAAYELHISQSALTMQIQQLESHLDTQLFDRNRRHVSLTPQGLDLLPQIQNIVADMEELILQARESSDPKRGTVTVAAVPSLAASLLPRAIYRLRQEYPRINIRIRDAVAAQVSEMTRNGEVDFGVGSQIKQDSELVWEKLMDDRFFALIGHDYHWNEGEAVTLRELADHPLILPVRESSIRMYIESAADKQKVALSPAYEAVYNSTVISLAAEGLGVAVLSDLVAPVGNSSRLRRISIINPPVYRNVGILRRSGRSLTLPAELFIETLQEITKETLDKSRNQ